MDFITKWMTKDERKMGMGQKKEKKKEQSNKQKKRVLSFNKVLNMYALIPLVTVAIALGVSAIFIANQQLKMHINNSMTASVKQIGMAFDYSTEITKSTMAEYASAPVIKDYLKNQNDAALAERAEQYTQDFFGQLEGWEGIYLANWDSKVLTHPAPPVVGKVMREGEKLQELRDAMTGSDGVYNVGIINSPASGELIMSLYMPIYEDGQPIGYIGAGTFVDSIAMKFTDVSALGLKSAYTYIVSPTGTMLSHPDETKIGNPVENEAVKKIVADLANGIHPESDCIEYQYKGATKYAAYYVNPEETYIAVVTADHSDVTASTRHIKNSVFIVVLIGVLLFGTASLLFAKVICGPLVELAKVTETLSTGDITAKCTAKSHINETSTVIHSFDKLTTVLQQSIGNVKESAGALQEAIVSVDDKTTYNVESISQINEAINDVSSTSQTVAENAQNMAVKNLVLEKNVEELNENVAVLYSAAQTIKNVNSEATQCMASVYEGSKDSVNAIHNISDKIHETNKAVENISKAIVAIESIATQTNLLSLNASIEAARAGEAGRGFAVVADEIRTLADSSAESAKEIKVIIESIMSLSEETVNISEQVTGVISKEQSDIEVTQEKFNELLESVEASLVEINKIKEMTISLDEVKSDMTTAISELSAVSEELGASAQEVAASCQVVTDACVDTQASTEEMRAYNENMTSAIAFFKLS